MSEPRPTPRGYEESKLTGEYELVEHDPTTFFQGLQDATKKDSTDYKGVNTPATIKLEQGGTVSGDKTGTWQVKEGTNQVEITLDGVTYEGDFALLPRQ